MLLLAAPGLALADEPAAPPPAPVPPPPPPPPQTEKRDKDMMFLLGAGVSFGFFDPGDVNTYIEDYVGSLSATTESGFSDMIMNIVPRVTLDFAPIEYVQIQAVGEVGWGPKIVSVVGGDSESFNYMRYSVGGMVNGHIPVRDGRNSVYLGAGVLYNWLSFEEFKASTPGYRGQVGFRFYLERFVPEVFVAFDYIRAETGKPMSVEKIPNPDGTFTTVESSKKMTLDYTSFLVGANFYFDLTY
ncbi:MAG: hypothetical protein PHU25_18150 [Deltaproteobacteria bacterium]|nr:hypothetical protein [Deltaproteobacteria bacterium]